MNFRLRPCAALLILLIECGCTRADTPKTQVYPGITYHDEARQDPPQHLYWATIDLSNPNISVHVSQGGPDPDGDGKWQTTLMPPTQIARREGFELAINGDFFKVKDRTGDVAYVAAQWATVLGAAASDGKAWSSSEKPRPCLIVKKSGKIAIESIANPSPDDAQVVGGNVILVNNGKTVLNTNTDKHPRTVAGVDAAGKTLTLLVVDGRRAGVATGMTYAELSKEMVAAGCDKAVNLDGGGSSVMVIRDGEKFVVKNQPSNEKERPVANVLGIDVKAAK